jgi:hypothetical protein
MPIDLAARRQLVTSAACGFGALALRGLFAPGAHAKGAPPAGGPPHHPPRARRVIFLFMQGGPSHVDSFDPKPTLDRLDGKLLPFDDARSLARTGKGAPQRVMRSPWKFARHGESGRWVSELFPHLARRVDDLCFLQGMQTEGVAHGPATLFLHTGSTNLVRPSLGAWLLHGLGPRSPDLPGFVTLAPTMNMGGPRNWGSAFLPAATQGVSVGRAGNPVDGIDFKHLRNTLTSRGEQRRHFAQVKALDRVQRRGHAGEDDPSELDAVLGSFALARRMQSRSSHVLDLSRESRATLGLYGVGEKATDTYGRLCLMARRLCEAGTRFVQVNYSDNSNTPAWDQHSDLPQHARHAAATDRPVAGLLTDLGQRGLLDDTLVWWGGEFGRTPYAERQGTGRDHNPGGFTVFLAGAGVRHGLAFGATDDFGHQAVEGKVHMRDLHATMLHLLGVDHTRLTFRHDGRDFRLTDLGGRVVREILS